MSDELKLCPWCKSADIYVEDWSSEDFQMACACGATGPMKPTVDEAYAAWNRRAGETG